METLKTLRKCSCFFVLFLFTTTAFTQIQVSTHIDNISTGRAIGIGGVGFENPGVKIKSSFSGTGSVTVEMRGTNPQVDSYYCGIPIFGFIPIYGNLPNFTRSIFTGEGGSDIPARMLLYKTTLSSINGSNTGSVYKGTGSPMESNGGETGVKVYNSEAFFQCNQEWNWNPVGSSIKTNHKTFYRRNIRTWEMMENVSDITAAVASSWHRMWRGIFPASVILTFTGALTLSDIDKIELPGYTLTSADFSTEPYPISKGENSAKLHITNVNVSLEKNVNAFSYNTIVDGVSKTYHYDGSYDDVWFSNKPIPPYSTIPQKPYRIPILKHASNDNGGYAYFGEDNQIEVYATNSTEIENLNLNFTIYVHNKVGTVGLYEGEFSYSVWIDYNKPNGIYNMNETTISLPTAFNPAHTQSERVKHGTLSSGAQLILENIPIPTNAFNGFTFSQVGQSKRTRLRIAIKKGNIPPTVDEIFDVGEVHDYDIVFKSSISSNNTVVPYDYLIYAEKELPYSDYKALRDNKTSSYKLETDNRLIGLGRYFKVAVQKNIPYALSKHSKAAYDNEVQGMVDMLTINNPSDKAIQINELDNTNRRQFGTEDRQLNSGANGTRKLNSLAYPYYKDVTFVETLDAMKDPNNLQDLPLYMDVYYPVPKLNKTMVSLEALPVVLWLPGGGFMWNQGRGYVKTTKPANWLASQGFVVVAVDYRQGFFPHKDLLNRAMMRAWMDSRTAVKWWRNSGYHEAYTDGNLTKSSTDGAGNLNPVLWKTHISNITVSGSSAGATTALHNAYLTEEMFLADAKPGTSISGISNNYQYTGDFGNQVLNIGSRIKSKFFGGNEFVIKSPDSFYPYDIRNYESIPCLDFIVGSVTYNTCDGFINNQTKQILTSTVTSSSERLGDVPDWALYTKYFTDYYKNSELAAHLERYAIPNDDPIQDQLRDRLYSFHSESGRGNKIMSFAGALIDKSWATRATNVPPVAEIHHIDDAAVPADFYYGFSNIDSNPSTNEMVQWAYWIKGIGKMAGGIAINRELNYPKAEAGVNEPNDKNFRLMLMSGPEKGGGGPGDIWRHQTQFTFGGVSYPENSKLLNGYDQSDVSEGGSNMHQLEKKTMYYANAFLAKDFGTTLNRVNETQTKLNTAEIKPIEEAKASVFIIFPNPTSGNLNVFYEMKQLGDVSISIYDITGKEMYNNIFGNVKDGRKTMNLSSVSKKLSSGLYLMKVITSTDIFTAKFLKQ
jgi:hypothetical protein